MAFQCGLIAYGFQSPALHFKSQLTQKYGILIFDWILETYDSITYWFEEKI